MSMCPDLKSVAFSSGHIRINSISEKDSREKSLSKMGIGSKNHGFRRNQQIYARAKD